MYITRYTLFSSHKDCIMAYVGIMYRDYIRKINMEAKMKKMLTGVRIVNFRRQYSCRAKGRAK